MTNKYTELLTCLGDAPDNEIDKTISVKFAEMAKRDTPPSSSDIIKIRNDCAYCALASGFAMGAINIFIDILKKDEKENV